MRYVVQTAVLVCLGAMLSQGAEAFDEPPVSLTGIFESASAGANGQAAPAPEKSGDCSRNIFHRLGAAYVEDAQPPDPNAPTPARRGLGTPLDSPAFPSAEWQLGGVSYPIGAPDENSQYPLEKALGCTVFGLWMKRHRIEMFGWLNAAANLSTSHFTNYPLAYQVRPNRVELNQAVLNIQRIVDTVQTDHLDWGFDISALYGYDYHFTTMKGVFSNQLLNNSSAYAALPGRTYGADPMLFYADIYVPWVAEGMVVRVGRWLSLPDIEAQFSPNNYLVTHSILYTADPYTQMGVLTTTRLNAQWTVQLGVHGSDDTAVWNRSARPTLQACVRWVSVSDDDMLYPCINSFNRDDYHYDNLQMYAATWGHRFSPHFHILTEAYWMYARGIPGYGPGGTPGVAGSSPYSGKAGEFGIVNYMNFELSGADMVSFRNEFYNDEKGQRTGYATRYSEHTVGLTHWVSQDLEIRPELRYDHSYDLPAYDKGRRDYQLVAVIDAIVHY
ncbi:outer membrane beta-barrel protein [Dyella choica]|nr:outer membrane beta-barrel protein [Dyella choica]